jgi:hypothetical protein
VQSKLFVLQALAVVAEPDSALRELIRRTIEGAGFVVLEVATQQHLDVVLRTRAAAVAPRVMLILPTTMVASCSPAVADWVAQRATYRCAPPCLLLTCEFGTLTEVPSPELDGCVSAGVLEKPFDFALLQGVAYRFRTFPPGVQPFVVSAR